VTDAERPEDETRPDENEAQAEETPAETAEEPAAAAQPGPAAGASADETPAAAEPDPAADASGEEPPAAAPPGPAAEEPAPAVAEEPAPAAAEEPAPAAPPAPEAPAPAAAEPTEDEDEVTPRVRPEIPGADLIPDLVSDTTEYQDAEARAAAEAEAEAAAARAAEESDQEESRPIADAAINLAAGARYTATGKRKTAVARVILKPGSGSYEINGKELDAFFPRQTLQKIIRQPLEAVGYDSRMDVVARMHGGGVAAQAGALRHGISRALLEADPNLRGELKRRGFLTRDPRVKERKKAGLKKARKRPQFSKR
jgi:small subunit ribosomal protein S9